jgi:molybdate transport system substrate-binding protein
MQVRIAAIASIIAGTLLSASSASAAEVKVLTAGAMKAVVLQLLPQFESQGHKVILDNDTAGGLEKRIEGGEAVDVAIITPAVLDRLIEKGKIATGTRANLARVGVGVVVKEGAPKPDIGNVEAFKTALLNAKTVAYTDPSGGASSGIYVRGMIEKLGLTDALKSKTKLKQGGYVADLIASGDAELGLHQISEILPVKGTVLVGPLPAELQNYTTYAVGLGAGAKDVAAAKALIELLRSPAAAEVLRQKGMERPS